MHASLEPPFARRCVLEFAKVSSTPMAMTCAGNYQTGLPNQYSRTTTCNLKVSQLMNLSQKSWTQTDSEEYPLEWASEIVLASLEKQGRSLLFIYSCGSSIELTSKNFLHFHILVKKRWAREMASNQTVPTIMNQTVWRPMSQGPQPLPLP